MYILGKSVKNKITAAVLRLACYIRKLSSHRQHEKDVDIALFSSIFGAHINWIFNFGHFGFWWKEHIKIL